MSSLFVPSIRQNRNATTRRDDESATERGRLLTRIIWRDFPFKKCVNPKHSLKQKIIPCVVDSNDVIVDCELNETAKERVKNTYQNPNYRNPSFQKTKTDAIKSRGNLSRGEHSYVARRQQSRMAPREYILVFVYILNNTITLFKTSIPFVRIHLIDDNTNPVHLSELYSIVAERGDDFGEHLVFFL